MNSGESNTGEPDAGDTINEQANKVLAEYLRQELNLQTLQDYLQRRFPSLEPASDEADLTKALRALQESGRKTLEDVNTLVDEQIGLVLDVISDLNGSARLATSIIRMSLFAATPDPKQLTAYATGGSSIDTLLESIQWCREQRIEAGAGKAATE
jgi:hypothetical protein